MRIKRSSPRLTPGGLPKTCELELVDLELVPKNDVALEGWLEHVRIIRTVVGHDDPFGHGLSKRRLCEKRRLTVENDEVCTVLESSRDDFCLRHPLIRGDIRLNNVAVAPEFFREQFPSIACHWTRCKSNDNSSRCIRPHGSVSICMIPA